MRTLTKLGAIFGLSAATYALLVRPRLLRWGASREEVRGPFPGEQIIPGGKRGATMAVTLDAAPSEVWKWLVQMGRDRAGWYSWDRLDNGGLPSAREVHPEWQAISAGQHLASTRNGDHWFEVAALEPERFLGLRASFDLVGRQFDPSSSLPRAFTDSLWAFQLKPLPDGGTRLVVSGYGAGRPRLLFALMNFLFWEPAHWIMQTRQFANLRRRVAPARAERRGFLPSGSPETRSPARPQA